MISSVSHFILSCSNLFYHSSKSQAFLFTRSSSCFSLSPYSLTVSFINSIQAWTFLCRSSASYFLLFSVSNNTREYLSKASMSSFFSFYLISNIVSLIFSFSAIILEHSFLIFYLFSSFYYFSFSISHFSFLTNSASYYFHLSSFYFFLFFSNVTCSSLISFCFKTFNLHSCFKSDSIYISFWHFSRSYWSSYLCFSSSFFL